MYTRPRLFFNAPVLRLTTMFKLPVLNAVSKRSWSNWGTEPIAEFETRRAMVQPGLKDLPSVLKRYALMRFLQYPQTAKAFAHAAVDFIEKGGLRSRMTVAMLKPLTSTFSMGATVPEVVAKAQKFLPRQQILLDYSEEMLMKAEERANVFREITRLLDTMANTDLLYVPIKFTGFLHPHVLEKMSRGDVLSIDEKQLSDVEIGRLFQVVEKAEKLGKCIFVDQEYPTQKKAIFDLTVKLMRRFNNERPVVYITLQATDKDCHLLVKQLATDSAIRFPGVKLVNGAYVNWAYEHNYQQLLQPSKMAAFITFILTAKFCLRRQIHLYMGTHNPLLEQIIDNFARALDVSKDGNPKFVKGQLYGFTTKANLPTMYSIFGGPRALVDYSLRRVIEGAESKKAIASPLMSEAEIVGHVNSSGLGESLSAEEIQLLLQAVRLNVQDARVALAKQEVKTILRLS